MELALPHVVVWTRGPGLGTDLVAALAAHPFEVSEVRGLVEAQRAAAGRQPMLVVLVCPQDTAARVAEATAQFPGRPILLVSDAPGNWSAVGAPACPPVTEFAATQPLEELCWHVAEALSRTAYTVNTPERRLGPMLIEIDGQGVVAATCDLSAIWFFPGPYPRPGASLLPLLPPEDRSLFTRNLAWAEQGLMSFFPVRVLDRRGSPHPMHAGLRIAGPSTVSLILQPLIDCAPIVGRRRGTRDPLTGLLDRWELWRQMETMPATDEPTTVAFVKLDAFETIAASMNFQQVDEVFDRVASALMQLFPWPAAPSRLTGGAFLVLVKHLSMERIEDLARHLIEMVNRIGSEGNPDDLRFGLSIGIASVTDSDYDLAVRLAETAVHEAQIAGGNRAVVAGPETLIRTRVGDLAANMDLEDWEVWLQPVVRGVDGRPEFHEALARFGTDEHMRISRPEFFTTGRLQGLLERFDRLVMLRSLELLTAHPELRLSINITRETFELESFPAHFLGLLRDAKVEVGRVILEISPACLAMPADMVRRRLRHLNAAAIEVALDDFGSGVCSLRHLTDYPLSIVKLDGLVTSYVGDDPLQRNFVRMVVNLCRARGIRTVAEYTRTSAQMERLVEDGVDLFQGELLGMPLPAAAALALLAKQPNNPKQSSHA